MTQRNFNNPRNTGDGPKGVARKSASSAKLKSAAGASVYSSSSKSKPDRKKRKEMSEEERQERQQDRRREQALGASIGTLPEYKKWRRWWWITLVVAIAAVGLSWLFSYLAQNGMIPESMQGAVGPVSIAGLVIGYVAIFAALYIDLGKIRKLRKAQEEKVKTLTNRQKRELDAAIEANDKQYQSELQQGRGFRMPWSKKNAVPNDGKGNVVKEGEEQPPAKKKSGKKN